MTNTEIKSKLAKSLKEIFGYDLEIKDNDRSLELECGMDSLDAVELVMEIEEEFNITLHDDEFERAVCTGYNALLELVTSKL